MAVFLASYAMGQSAGANSAAADHVLHDGTPIYLATGRTVSSESDQPGEQVEFLVKKDVTVGGAVLIPAESSVFGTVTASRLDDRAAGRGGMVEFRLASIKLPNGQLIPLRNIKDVPTAANADVSTDALTNLVNSPYAPFAHFDNGTTTTVPKNSLFTLYVAADVAISNQPAPPMAASSGGAADSVAAHITNTANGSKSLGDIAREQRERGKISGGMVTPQQN